MFLAIGAVARLCRRFGVVSLSARFPGLMGLLKNSTRPRRRMRHNCKRRRDARRCRERKSLKTATTRATTRVAPTYGTLACVGVGLVPTRVVWMFVVTARSPVEFFNRPLRPGLSPAARRRRASPPHGDDNDGRAPLAPTQASTVSVGMAGDRPLSGLQQRPPQRAAAPPHHIPSGMLSMKLSSWRLPTGCWSLRTAFASLRASGLAA
jgi:hypothetical protein